MMMFLMESAGVLLAALFAMSAIAKSTDPSASADMMRDLGLSQRWTGAAARALVFGELVVAVGLVAGPLRSLAADAALVLLVVFTLAVGVVAWSGRRMQCGCFGTSEEPQPGQTIIGRNLVLGALAVLASHRPHDAGQVNAGWAVPITVAAALGVLVLVVMLVVGLRTRALGPEMASTSEPVVRDGGQIVVRRTVGDPITLAELTPNLPVLVLFLDTACPGCVALLDRPAPDRRGDVEVVTLVVDPTGARPDLQGRSDVIVVTPETFTDAAVPGTPCGMLFGPGWQLLGEPLLGGRAIGFALAAAVA